jgi:hypothetical protein
VESDCSRAGEGSFNDVNDFDGLAGPKNEMVSDCIV